MCKVSEIGLTLEELSSQHLNNYEIAVNTKDSRRLLTEVAFFNIDILEIIKESRNLVSYLEFKEVLKVFMSEYDLYNILK